MAYLDPAGGEGREVYSSAGAPGAGTNEVETITIGGTPTGGSFKLQRRGFMTAAIPWSAVNATLVASIDAALEALPNIGTAGVTVAVGTMTAGIGTITVTFDGGNVQKRALQVMTVASNDLTGAVPTVVVTVTTPGVTADGRGASKGATLIRQDTGAHYQNLGTPAAPNWSAL